MNGDNNMMISRDPPNDYTRRDEVNPNNNDLIVTHNMLSATSLLSTQTIEPLRIIMPLVETPDVRALGIVRSMDLFMYVLYSDDQKFVRDMVTKVTIEVAHEQECEELAAIMDFDSPQMYRCLFFLMLDFHSKFRYWALEENNGTGLQPVCPFKAVRFMRALRCEIVPRFLVAEMQRLDDLERALKVEYIRS